MKRGNLVFWDTHRHRWTDAIGPEVCKFVEHFERLPVDDTTGLPLEFTSTLVNASTVALTAGVAGGVLDIATAGAENDGVNMQLKGESFKLASGKELYFGCRFSITDATQSDFIVGLCITDTTLLGGTSDGVYFRKVDGSTDVKFVLEKDSTETESAAILTADTDYHILEFYFDGTYIDYYVDGVKQTRPAVTNLPDDEELTPSIHFLTGEGAGKHLYVDWMRCIQLN
jgi:hypothetical protein